MWQIASQMLLCLLLAGLIGAVAGWALAVLMGRDRAARLEAATARLAGLERDLALATRRATESEAARARLDADLDGALVRTQDLELRRRSAEDRTRVAQAALTAVTERGAATEEALRVALARATEAEAAARDAGALTQATTREAQSAIREAAGLREQAETRWRAETVRAAHAEEAIRALEAQTAEELEPLRDDRERLQASLRDALERLDALQTQLDSSRERTESSLEAEASARAAMEQRLRQALDRATLLEASHRALESARDAAEARLRSLEDALREGDGEREEVEARLQGLEGRLRLEQDGHQRAQMRILELTRLLEARSTPRLERATRPPPPREGIVGRRAVRRPRRDDLKEIIGVGPVLERLLHRHGVRTFRQVALWTREDIRRIDAFLHDFHGRIRRDHWVRQARALHRRFHGESLRTRTGNGAPAQEAPPEQQELLGPP